MFRGSGNGILSSDASRRHLLLRAVLGAAFVSRPLRPLNERAAISFASLSAARLSAPRIFFRRLIVAPFIALPSSAKRPNIVHFSCGHVALPQ